MDNTENKYEKYLPLGTVVSLKDGTKKLMITGFCNMDKEVDAEMYDYSGCLYPEGILTTEKFLLFNHENIDKIYHLGLQDEEEQKFKDKLNETLKALNLQ